MAAVLTRLMPFDQVVRVWIATHRVGVVTPVMWGLSAVGRGGIVWLVVAAILSLLRRMRALNFVVLLLAILLASTLANRVLKPWVGRERPFASSSTIRVIGGLPKDASFPSGHAANAFAGAFVLSRAVPSGRIIWWATACAIAYSRVYLGVHYPLDVLAGALVGLMSGFLACRLVANVSLDRMPSLRRGR